MAALAVLAVVCSQLFAARDAVSITAGMAVAYAIPRALYTTRSWCSTTGRWVFTALGIVMAALLVVTIWKHTLGVGHTLDDPLLMSDDRGYYNWALSHYDGRCETPRKLVFIGFPLMILQLWRVLGVSVVWPLVMNVMFTLTTIVVGAATTCRLLKGRTQQSVTWLATVSLCMTVALCYFLSQGLRVQKEATVYLAFSLVGYVLAGISAGDTLRWRDWALWLIGAFMLALTRNTFLYFAAMGLIIVCLPHLKQQYKPLLIGMALVGCCYLIGNHLAYYSVDKHIDMVKGGYYMKKYFSSGSVTQQPYNDIIGDYFMNPIWKRLPFVPLACCVQYIIPFPWVYDSPTILSLLPRLRWGWYVVGGLVLFYYTLQITRRGRRQGVGAWAWWLAAIYLVIAYLVAGTVSRYLLPIEPLAVPIAVLVVAWLREGLWRKTFAWWALGYLVAMAITLVVCYRVQSNYLQDLHNYYESATKQMPPAQ